jgi:replicative DNA helicase
VAKTFDIEAECKTVISLLDSDQEVQAYLVKKLKPEHFESDFTKLIFSRVMSLLASGKTIPKSDVLKSDTSVSDEAKNILQGTITPLTDVGNTTLIVDTLELYRQYRILLTSAKSQVDIHKEELTQDSLTRAKLDMEQALIKARSMTDEAPIIHAGIGRNSNELTREVLESERSDKILTGFDDFDRATGGFTRTNVVVIGAPSGAGKTHCAITLRNNMYTIGKANTLLLGLEMSNVEYQERHLSNVSLVDYEKIYMRTCTATQKAKIFAAEEAFQNHGLKFNKRASLWCPIEPLTMNQISDAIRPLAYDVVLIDYLGLISGNEEQPLWERLGEHTKYAKMMAKRNNQVVIIFVQLDETTLQVKYSKAIRHHASFVWKWQMTEKEEQSGVIELVQDKVRSCKRFNFPLVANFDVCKFNNFTGGMPQQTQVQGQSQFGEKALTSMASLDDSEGDL